MVKRTQAPSRLDNENGQMQSMEDFYNAEPTLTSSNGQHSIYKFHILIQIIKMMHSLMHARNSSFYHMQFEVHQICVCK